MPESGKKVACSSPAVVAPHPTNSLNTPRLKNRDSLPLTSIEQMSELRAKFFFSPPAESIEKGEKRFTVADVLQLVNIKRQKMLDDTCSGVAQPAVYNNKFDKQENIEENRESNHFSEVEKMPQTGTLFPPLPFGSRLVYMGNLHPAITESDVLEFFKDVGKVDWVKFMGIPDNRFGHVRFETYAASRKALKRDGEKLIDRPVDLHAVEERTIFDVFTPCPGKPRGYGRARWAGHGPTLGPFCCNCTPYGAGRGCNI